MIRSALLDRMSREDLPDVCHLSRYLNVHEVQENLRFIHHNILSK